MSERVYLRRTHPGLFLGVMGIGATHLVAGGLLLLAPKLTPLTAAFVAPFFAVGAAIIYGTLSGRYRGLTRPALLVGLVWTSFFGIAFAMSVVTSLNAVQTRQLSWLIAPWEFWSFAHFVAVSEVPANPIRTRRTAGERGLRREPPS